VRAGDRKLYTDQFLRAIDWALEPDEAKRPQTVADFRRALFEDTAPVTAPAPNPEPVPRPPAFAPEILSSIERALALHLGPVAPVLVRRTAKQAMNFDALTRELAAQIPDQAERNEFLTKVGYGAREVPTAPPAPGSEPATLPPRFTPTVLSNIEAELVRHIGPLAKVLVKKAAQKARDQAELYLLLADNISDTTERKAFVRKSLQAFREKR